MSDQEDSEFEYANLSESGSDDSDVESDSEESEDDDQSNDIWQQINTDILDSAPPRFQFIGVPDCTFNADNFAVLDYFQLMSSTPHATFTKAHVKIKTATRLRRGAFRFASRATYQIRPVSPLPPSPQKVTRCRDSASTEGTRFLTKRQRPRSVSPRKPLAKRFSPDSPRSTPPRYQVQSLTPTPARYHLVNRSRVHPADPRLPVVCHAHREYAASRDIRPPLPDWVQG